MSDKKQPRERLRRTKVASDGVQKTPLFPSLDTGRVRALRTAVIVGDEVEDLDDVLDPMATELDCYNLLGSEITRDVHLQIRAIGLTENGREETIAEREVHVFDQAAPPTRKGPSLAPDPAPLRVRSGTGVTVATREHVVTPNTISTTEAREANRENATIHLIDQVTRSVTRALEEGTKAIFTAQAAGVRELISGGQHNELVQTLRETVSSLRVDKSELECQIREQRSNHITERTALELDVLKKTQEWIKKVGDLETEVLKWKKKHDEAKEEADMREGMLKRFATETALEHGPGIIGQILERIGIKLELPAAKKDAA